MAGVQVRKEKEGGMGRGERRDLAKRKGMFLKGEGEEGAKEVKGEIIFLCSSFLTVKVF